MTPDNLTDVAYLKQMAMVTGALETVTANPDWKKAYRDLHNGAALLWRLVDRAEIKDPPDKADSWK